MPQRRMKISKYEQGQLQAARIVKRLTDHIKVKLPEIPDPDTGQLSGKYLSDSQVRACLGLLKKWLPDLKSIELVGDPDHPVIQEIRRTIIDPQPTNGPDIPAPAEPE